MEKEAIIFTKYLIGELPDSIIIKRYEEGITVLGLNKIDEQEKKILRYAYRYPILIGFFDNANSFFGYHLNLGKRLLLLNSILETSPLYYEHFLYKKRSLFYFCFLAIIGLLSTFKILIGLVIIKIIKG